MSKRRSTLQKNKSARRAAAAAHPSGQSQYGRKKRYCDGKGLFGFQVPDPKPWK